MFVVRVPGMSGIKESIGCENGGNFILEFLKEINTNERGAIVNLKLLDLDEIHLDNSNKERSGNLIYKNASEIFESKPKTIFLGGDHSISYFLIKAFFDVYKEKEDNICLLVFDSSPNCTDDDSLNSMNWVRHLIKEGIPPQFFLLVGIRGYSPSELIFLKENKIRFFGMNNFLENMEDSCNAIMEFAKDKEIYISIDMDVIDPSFVPATCIQIPGGFTSRQFLYLVQRINFLRNIRAVDIVGVNPKKDFNNLTVKLAAKILSEFL